MKNYKKGFIIMVILLVIVIILAVGGIAYYMGKDSRASLSSDNNLKKENFIQENQIITNNTSSDCLPTTSPWVSLVSPNGGEYYTMGQNIIVKWKTCNAEPNQTVSLSIGKEILASQNNGISGAFGEVVSFLPTQMENDGTETLALGGSSTGGDWPFDPGMNYKIIAVLNPLPTNTQETKIISDVSDNSFTIKPAPKNACDPKLSPYIKVVSPNGGESYSSGDVILVKWESCNIPSGSSDISIDLYPNGDINNSFNLTDATSNDGSQEFEIPDLEPGNYKVHIKYSSTKVAQDSSDNLFTLK